MGAVSYVHKQSCVHRDLKLENILFDKHENVKLVDFGFTREYEGRTNHLQTFCGTICYSAPEMLKGEKYAGEKVDVWSLGVILYALLCGELPFDDDDDNVTRSKILGQEPKFPAHLPPDGVALIKSLLSKRPILRPSLPEILSHPFLSDYAAAQKLILEIKPEQPFSTPLEKECLQRMRSAGVDIDAVIESVLAEKVDTLAGWWTLLLEKEQRKQVRRERKRREKETERSLRRLSGTSSRLGSILQEVDETGSMKMSFSRTGELGSQRRGRSQRRSAQFYELNIGELPQLKEHQAGISDDSRSIRSVRSIRSASTYSHRPIPPPKEGVVRGARSRGSTLYLITTADAAPYDNQEGSQTTSEATGPGSKKPKKKPSQAFIAHWKNWTHWVVENTRRKKSHEKHASKSTPDLRIKDPRGAKEASPRPQTSKHHGGSSPGAPSTAALPKGVVANGHLPKTSTTKASSKASKPNGNSLTTPTQQFRPRLSTSQTRRNRHSISPAPMTPRSAIRRPSGGLRGRKSTSSSVSSVRSMHHHRHSHSKASSTSSTGSVTIKTPIARTHSPHHSIKVLPATPNANALPSNIRLVRASPAPAPIHIYNEGMPSRAPGSPNPFATGVQFAKRKKNLFKGPSLNFGASASSSRAPSSGGHSRSGSGSALGRRSGEQAAIQEEDEDYLEEDVEEVEVFNPVVGGPGETIEERIIEDGEEDEPMHSPMSEIGLDLRPVVSSR